MAEQQARPAIILSAGLRRRQSSGVPKSLLQVGGTSILRRQGAAWSAAGVQRFVIVTGFEAAAVRGHLAGLPGDFLFVNNDRYAQTNTIHSLYLVRDHLVGGSFFANGDVVFDRRLPERLAAAAEGTWLAVTPGRCAQEEVKVVVEAGRITRIGKQLDPTLCLGEFVGVARFGADLGESFAEQLRACVEDEHMLSEHFEAALDRLCPTSDIRPLDIHDLPCREIDFPEDLHAARTELVPRLLPA